MEMHPGFTGLVPPLDPSNALEIRVSLSKRIALFIALGGLFVLPMLASAIFAVVGGEPRRAADTLLVALCAAALFGLPVAVMLRSKSRSVRVFEARGVICHNGRVFLWSEFQGVREVYGGAVGIARFINNYDLVFASGKAPVYHRTVANGEELGQAISALQAGTIPWLAPRQS